MNTKVKGDLLPATLQRCFPASHLRAGEAGGPDPRRWGAGAEKGAGAAGAAGVYPACPPAGGSRAVRAVCPGRSSGTPARLPGRLQLAVGGTEAEAAQ